jgi:hypothetical protein
LSAEDAVNTYLIEHHDVCLEEVIADATEGKVRASLARAIETTATRLDQWRDEDGAVAELFDGTLTLNGARYAWRAAIYTDLDGGRFVADLMQFEPVDWRARVRLVQ